MKINLHIHKSEERYNPICQATIPEHFEGRTSALVYGGNTALQGDEIRFDGFSRKEVIDSVIAELKARGLHGTLHVIDD